jgi:hypothetical protein
MKPINKNPGIIPDGGESGTISAVPPPYPLPQSDQCDVIGDTVTIGTTWFELQHHCTVGRMLARDQFGNIHFCWTNGLEVGANTRLVYYNYIDPAGQQGWLGTGYPNVSERSGYANLDMMPDDFLPVFTFNWFSPLYQEYNTAVAAPYWLWTAISEPDTLDGLQITWPKMAIEDDGLIRIISTGGIGMGEEGHVYYTEGYPDQFGYVSFPPSPDTWTLVSETTCITPHLAASPVSDRIAFAWMKEVESSVGLGAFDNDIWMLIDDDGEDLHFEDAFNVTNFIPPDYNWLPDTVLANMDTLRAYGDLHVFIDQDDWVHLTFTTRSFFALWGYTYWHPSIIWHWSEQFPNEYVMVHNAFDDWWWNYLDCGAWNVKAQRSCLSQDPQTGYLYCTYQVYDCDSTAISAAGWPSGEIYVSVSTDGGQNWSVGTNVTETITPSGASAGQCLSEVHPSTTKIVDQDLHIMYILDRDAGCVIQDEGSWTLNDVIYHKVPVDLIPEEPLIPQGVPFHVYWPPHTVTDDNVGALPGILTHQAYPNPFNPTTTISFDLPIACPVSLDIFDINGRNVGAGFKPALEPAQSYPPGTHHFPFDGSDLPSGIYIYRLIAGDYSAVGKMVLMK